ncbi:hypothetical protein QTP70_005287 [Hemibagrus guttatus]|uniref:Reverse transcriptase domain-containing protein n=1 Tax=Hemibagrus guttatus TaxID=175788 RepID=A0AAE0ULE4_9TELE|nr:hypothetical protein QTP70_005287 [Hemibagrus guttatus]KAK3532170.1 hypothetical protein QTP86_009189 [Hemibagrus guttatus]
MHSLNHIIKFADDTTVVGLISKNDESAYREEVQRLTAWCRANNLSLNVDQTKAMVVDFRRVQSDHSPLFNDGSPVEIIKSTKFLDVHLVENFTWSLNTSSISKKAQTSAVFPVLEAFCLNKVISLDPEMWPWVLAVVLPVMVTMQECPELQPAPPSGIMTRPYPGVLINNLQWVHVPVLVNLTAWSPDMDERCRGESVTEMYKDLLTTAFLRYHGAVATSSSTEQMLEDHPEDRIKGVSSRRKLLGFVDNMLGATGTGLGISNWISAQELRQNELKLKALVGQQVLQTDAYLQEGLSEEKETVQDVHTIASALSVIAQQTKKAFNTMQKQLYCAQFASIKHQEITHILKEVLAGKVPPTLFTEEVLMKCDGPVVRGGQSWTIMFADGIVICSKSREQVEENLERWRFALERRGMSQS